LLSLELEPELAFLRDFLDILDIYVNISRPAACTGKHTLAAARTWRGLVSKGTLPGRHGRISTKSQKGFKG
jgi:hypothetical protein